MLTRFAIQVLESHLLKNPPDNHLADCDVCDTWQKETWNIPEEYQPGCFAVCRPCAEKYIRHIKACNAR